MIVRSKSYPRVFRCKCKHGHVGRLSVGLVRDKKLNHSRVIVGENMMCGGENKKATREMALSLGYFDISKRRKF